MTMTMEDLNTVLQRAIGDEYQIVIVAGGALSKKVHVSLEKGSTYGEMHMKFTADAPTVMEAFEKCLANFPPNPMGALWDTKRIASPIPLKEEYTEGQFTEAPPPAPDLSDDIPF